MRIINHTNWHTGDLERIALACAARELSRDKVRQGILTFETSQWTKRGLRGVLEDPNLLQAASNPAISQELQRNGGYAELGGHSCVVCLPEASLYVRDTAFVICHEFAHLMGMTHWGMPDYLTEYSHRNPRWHFADGFRIRRQRASTP